MHNPTLVLAAICVFGIFSAATPAAVGGPSYFAIGGIYRDGRISDGERDFRAVLQRPDARAEFASTLRSSSRVRQLYALLGLHLTDRIAFQRELPAFVQRRDRVSCMSGCSEFDEEVGRVAQRIAQGNYDRAFSSPAR